MKRRITKTQGPSVKTPISPALPVWYQPEAPLGSAVKYVASLSPKFSWTGIYILRGNWLELGPFIGAKTENTRIPVGRGIRGAAVAKGADQNVPDVSSADQCLARGLDTRSELVVLIHDRAGRILGQIDIDSHVRDAFEAAEEEAVRKVAQELGELWPE